MALMRSKPSPASTTQSGLWVGSQCYDDTRERKQGLEAPDGLAPSTSEQECRDARVPYLGRDSDFTDKGDTMKLTKRGKRVRAVAILLAVWAWWQISGHLWWVEDHYCWGTMTECFFGEK
jgi:hypothetical protein